MMIQLQKQSSCLGNVIPSINFSLNIALMGKLFSHLSVVNLLTLLSRFLGLGRDILFFSCFGASLIGEAFILAFTFPNLFRRMFGEGTLTSAFLPIFTETNNGESRANAFTFLIR